MSAIVQRAAAEENEEGEMEERGEQSSRAKRPSFSRVVRKSVSKATGISNFFSPRKGSMDETSIEEGPSLDSVDVTTQLANSAPLSQLSGEQLADLAKQSTVEAYADAERIFKKGEVGDKVRSWSFLKACLGSLVVGGSVVER